MHIEQRPAQTDPASTLIYDALLARLRSLSADEFTANSIAGDPVWGTFRVVTGV